MSHMHYVSHQVHRLYKLYISLISIFLRPTRTQRSDQVYIYTYKYRRKEKNENNNTRGGKKILLKIKIKTTYTGKNKYHCPSCLHSDDAMTRTYAQRRCTESSYIYIDKRVRLLSLIFSPLIFYRLTILFHRRIYIYMCVSVYVCSLIYVIPLCC